MHKKIDDRERAIIAQHLEMSGQDLATLIERECNIILAPVTCLRIAAEIRAKEALKVDAALAVIETSITEWMQVKTPTYLKYLDDNILQIVNMINNKDEYCKNANGEFSADAFQKLSKLLGDQISVLMKIGGKQSPGETKQDSRDVNKNNVIHALDDIMKEYYDAKLKDITPGKEVKSGDFTILEDK